MLCSWFTQTWTFRSWRTISSLCENVFHFLSLHCGIRPVLCLSGDAVVDLESLELDLTVRVMSMLSCCCSGRTCTIPCSGRSHTWGSKVSRLRRLCIWLSQSLLLPSHLSSCTLLADGCNYHEVSSVLVGFKSRTPGRNDACANASFVSRRHVWSSVSVHLGCLSSSVASLGKVQWLLKACFPSSCGCYVCLSTGPLSLGTLALTVVTTEGAKLSSTEYLTNPLLFLRFNSWYWKNKMSTFCNEKCLLSQVYEVKFRQFMWGSCFAPCVKCVPS